MIRALPLLLISGIAAAANVTATWTAPTQNTDGSPITKALTYNLYVGASGAESKLQSALATASTTFPAPAGVQVCAQVTAVTADGESAKSSEACVTPPFSPPGAPTGIMLTIP